MSLNQPIFIIGTGRSGATVFADFLRIHPEFSSMTILSHRYPNKSYLTNRGYST
jgi:hypothetical protein